MDMTGYSLMNQHVIRKSAVCIAALLTITATSAVSPYRQAATIPVDLVELEIIQEIPLSSDIPGVLEFVDPSKEGAIVTVGQVIIRMDDDLPQAELASARKKAESTTEIDFAKIALAKAKIDEQVQIDANARAKNQKFPPYTAVELRQSRLEVQKQEATLRKATDEIEILKLDVKIKEAQLQPYVVTSPVDGVVTQVLRFPGQAVRQGDPVLTVTDLTVLRAKLKVEIEYRDQISIGQEVIITIGRETVSTAAVKSSSSTRPGTGSVLSGAPGLRKTAPQQRPTEQPEVTTPQPTGSADAQTFIGTIYFISPKLEGSGSGQRVTVYASVPNRFENGKYVLSAGTKISAATIAAGQ
jgi:multidrug efflux pump subunit AcrA (membrane-fusion protein)